MKNNKIKILDKSTANQIAAGEVIENPGSVVKELVENSIDAGSTKIRIKVEKGGTELIVVEDDGAGMTKDDLVLAIERHATSKINKVHDLNSLISLGFRGEALPSIASVAKVGLTSKTADDLLGWKLSLEDGIIKSITEKGCNTGTTVVVENLFNNTPARKKYLKNPLVEMAGITDIIFKLTLAYPAISFTLLSNNRSILKTPGTGKLIDVITCLWGTEMSNNLIPLSYRTDIKLEGYLGKINYYRPNKKGQFFFINSRYVKSDILARSLEDGYRTLLPINKFPFGIINVIINPAETDVNIHPTKLQVKFANPEKIQNLLREEVNKTVQNNIKPTNEPINFDFFHTGIVKERPSIIPDLQLQHNEQLSQFDQFQHAKQEISINQEEEEEEEILVQETFLEFASTAGAADSGKLSDFSNEYASLKPLGQLHLTYIICEGDAGLYLIDQHAAHERIIYNKLFSGQEQQVSLQQLVFPVTVELTPTETELVIENIFNFKNWGFVLEYFGGKTFVIREVPQDLPGGEEKDCFYQLLGFFAEQYQLDSLEFRDKVITMLACKKAVKAGDLLTGAEINYILGELKKAANYPTCPHGRPTVILFPAKLIGKKFMRK